MIDNENNTESSNSEEHTKSVQALSETVQSGSTEDMSTDNKNIREESVAEVLDEIHKLAYAEIDNLDYLPRPIGSVKRPRHLFLKLLAAFTAAFVILFFVTAHWVFGGGWIINMINKTGNFRSFSIPVVSHPELEEKYYQQDGRYTVEGVNRICAPSIVTIEAYVDETVFAAYGQGSGVIMTSDGYIITNAHVIEDAQLAIIVRLNDGSEYNAKVIGSDIKSDLAVIKINASGLTPAQFGDSTQLEIGEQIIALGSPAGFEASVTTGIVSGLDRMIKVESYNISMNCIQIDAAINPGNSGGALLNMWGQVVGITSSKLEAMEYDNIGFAISMDSAKPIIEQLIENGAVLGRPKVGISFYEVSDSVAGVYGIPAGLHIAEISPDCDVANTELAPDDIITSMNGIDVRSADDVYDIILKLSPGDEVTCKVVRISEEDGSLNEFEITFKLMSDAESAIQPEVMDPEEASD